MVRRPTHTKLEQRVKTFMRAEEALRESLGNQTYQFIGLLEPDGTLLEANKTALQYIGARKSDVLGKPLWETPWWIHSQEQQCRLQEAVTEAATGKSIHFEATHLLPDSSLIYVDFSLRPVREETGKTALLIAEGQDITDRKATEDALRRSENAARALLNGTMDRAMLLDRDGMMLAVNGKRAFGKRVEEIIGTCVFDYFPHDLAQLRKAKFLEAISTRRPVRFEDSFRGRFVDHNLYPILDAGGEVVQVAVHVRDITDYKVAMSRLEDRTNDLTESEAKYRTLVENIPVVVYRIGPSGRILFVNHFVEEMFGYTPEEIMKNPELWRQMIFPKDGPLVKELRLRSLTEGKEFSAEYRVRHKKGHLLYVAEHAIPVRSASGRVHSVDGFIMDVTSRVKLQERLVRAEELKTISEVSARLAHEIRNPLVSVGGFARRLLSTISPGDPNRAKVEIIAKEAGRMEAILRMILSYIQPLELHMSPADPNDLVKAALAGLRHEIGLSKVNLVIQLAPELPNISVDREHIVHVVEVLVRNALNQISGNTTLFVSTAREEGMFSLSFRYPVEMSPDEVDHFFYPFKWTQAAHEVVDLPLTKILVDKHGGTINVSLVRAGEIFVQVLLPFRP